MSRSEARIAVAGAGLVGRRHAEIVAGNAVLAGIADPAESAREVAARHGAPSYPDLDSLLDSEEVDAVIVATPNQRHEADALSCITRGIPVLVEKPIAEDAAASARIVAAAEAAGVPLLAGHHRRYNPIIAVARTIIERGDLGRITTVNATCWLAKPEVYFEAAWRREPGAGPILINLIHDIELLLHFCGPVNLVQAVASSAARGFEVEDTAAALLTFASGALGTVSVSDAAVAPWSWELTAAENPTYPQTGQSAYLIAGTQAALSIPDLTLWRHQREPDWMTPIDRVVHSVDQADPLVLQVAHLCEVALGRAQPRVSGRDGLKAMRVIEAIKKAAASGQPVQIG